MHQQMCWLPKSGGNGEKILYLQTEPNQPWRPYTAFRGLTVPDYQIPGGSKGWATYQKLLKAGWTLVPSTRANEFGSSSYVESTAQNQ
ncbi:hypothetical protein FM036_27750 [Nostoc sp. HG1]|uniref:hypothetical protein n=1 Tax=Nostoc commune TaxID=1178 RepID=UPI0018C7E548|nr:hypothetical protein [Nostoc commune]MBC6434208.1 hypothetical protein [Nostoc sp. HG1]MBG1257764.1 hypothetical protein [Nostoc commune BAE]MCL6750418.1 hypothetical protein [Nostoc sp. CCCryo 231-06]